MQQAAKKRDLTLDIAKGIAIMLVVLGHTLQRTGPDFDTIWAFRIIYAFHMPLFMLLAGMVAGLRPAAAEKGDTPCRATGAAIGKSAIRLLIPFAVWTVIDWYLSRRADYTLGAWAAFVAENPDNSLWFLLAAFYCSSLWQLWHLAARYGRFAWLRCDYLLLPLSLLITQEALRRAGGHYGIGYIKFYYGYYCAGVLLQLYGRNIFQEEWWKKGARFLPLAFFIAFMPGWHRTTPCDGLALWFDRLIGMSGDTVFRVMLALSASLVILDLSRIFASAARFEKARNFVAYCGTASLGIYAFHRDLLGYPPPFVTPLLLSLGLYWVTSRIPVIRTLLIGER